jgi:predicted RNase H-like nuclease (RuvC/YqgF family)
VRRSPLIGTLSADTVSLDDVVQGAKEAVDAHSRLALAIKTDEVLMAQCEAEVEKAERLRVEAELGRAYEQLSQARVRLRDLQAKAQLANRHTEQTSSQAERAHTCTVRLAAAEERIDELQAQLTKARAECRTKGVLVKALQVRWTGAIACMEHQQTPPPPGMS